MPGNELDHWKVTIQEGLDEAVAKNFRRLFFAKRDEYDKIWQEISREAHAQYLQPGSTDEEARLKKHYLEMSIEIYSEEEFPEIRQPRVLRFVEKYGLLPSRMPENWKNFEKEDRDKERSKFMEAEQMLREYLKNNRASNSQQYFP